MSCPRCNQHSDPSATTCPSCHALIAAVPVPFFRGADDWRHPNAPPPPPPRPPQTDSELASQFADPVFDLAQDASFALAEHDTIETPALPPREPVISQLPVGNLAAANLAALDSEEPMSEPTALAEPLLGDVASDAGETRTPPLPPFTDVASSEPVAGESVVAAQAQIIHATLAPTWRRLAAMAIDALPLGGALMLMLLLFERDLEAGGAPLVPTSLHQLARVFLSLGAHAWVILAVLVAVSVVYHTFSLAFMRATVGDMLLGIRWLTLEGNSPRLGRALTRAVLAVPSWLLAMFGVWYVLLSRTRRTLYDTLTGCYPVLRSS